MKWMDTEDRKVERTVGGDVVGARRSIVDMGLFVKSNTHEQEA